MLHADYNLLTLKNLVPGGTYLDKLPKDLVWYMLGYTGPKDGYIVMKKPSFGRGSLQIVKATTVHTQAELRNKYMSIDYGPQIIIESVKYIFIDGKQYAAVPIKGRIDGFTPPKTSKTGLNRCIAQTTLNRRCKQKTQNIDMRCSKHRTSKTLIPTTTDD
jgi:hypothetical protein